MNYFEKSLRTYYVKNGNILASDILAGHNITNMFLVIKSALQVLFLHRQEIVGEEPRSSNIKNMKMHQMCWKILKTH